MAGAPLYVGQNGPTTPADNGTQLTPSDTVDFTFTPKGIWNASATGGTFTWVGADGAAVPGYLGAGQFAPVRPRRINATGFTSGMVIIGLRD